MGTTLHRRPDRPITEFMGMATAAQEMLDFFEQLKRVARSDASVLIRGETGTGKELVAKAIHQLSPRRPAPFRALNCATLTPELLASELFGHVRGAFTGAYRDRQGLFALAHKGTMFLDEIAELPLELQARLLRVIQEKTFIPVGGTDRVSVDVRIISATHKALREEVAQRRFREDLMYRVRVVPLFLPRLADRAGDIEAMAWHFIDLFNQKQDLRAVKAIDEDALDAMLSYDWPGNIRELRNVIEYAFVIGDGEVLTLDDLTPELRGEPPPSGHRAPMNAQELERAQLLKALREARGRKARAAELLGISRSTLWRKLREHRIEPPK